MADADGGGDVRITDIGHSQFSQPAWLPDGRTLAVLGHRFPARAGSRNDIWLFAADGSDSGPAGGRNLSGRHDLMPGSGMGSDVTPGEDPRLARAYHSSSYATGLIDIDGTVTAGDTDTITIGGRAYYYTLSANDTLQSLRDGLIVSVSVLPPEENRQAPGTGPGTSSPLLHCR